MDVGITVEGLEVRDIRSPPFKCFIRGDTTICGCGGTIQAMCCSVNSLSPEHGRTLSVLHHGTYALGKGPVHPFSYPILLWCVRDGEFQEDPTCGTILT